MSHPHSTAVIALLATTLNGCSWLIDEPAEPARPTLAGPLELPDAPSLPYVSAQELACLTPEAYRRLVEREVRYKEYVEALHAVIQSAREAKTAAVSK